MNPPAAGCAFCLPNWPNLKVVDQSMTGSIVVIEPPNPVTDGHLLVIHRIHSVDASTGPDQASALMAHAAKYVAKRGLQANLIASIGPDAGGDDQTVQHLHLHIVPRRPGDGLALPWTPRQEQQIAPASTPAPAPSEMTGMLSMLPSRPAGIPEKPPSRARKSGNRAAR